MVAQFVSPKQTLPHLQNGAAGPPASHELPLDVRWPAPDGRSICVTKTDSSTLAARGGRAASQPRATARRALARSRWSLPFCNRVYYRSPWPMFQAWATRRQRIERPQSDWVGVSSLDIRGKDAARKTRRRYFQAGPLRAKRRFKSRHRKPFRQVRHLLLTGSLPLRRSCQHLGTGL